MVGVLSPGNHRVISELRETFMKRYIVERTKKAETRRTD